MALCRQVVNLVRLHHLHDAYQAAGVRHIPVVQNEAAIPVMRVLVQMIDPVRVEQRSCGA